MKILLLISIVFLGYQNVSAQHYPKDSAAIYHIQDSLLFDWARNKQKNKNDLSELNEILRDTVKIIGEKRGLKSWGYKDPGYNNPCEELIERRIDDAIRQDTIRNKKAHRIKGSIGNEFE